VPRSEETSASALFPELLRRVLALGFTGFFLTEEAVRKALGDTLPRDWVDFASEQSERTRAEFLERLARELGDTVERIDLVALAEQLLSRNSIEIKAEIRFVPGEGRRATRTTVKLEIPSLERRR
jgi:hypothetical protein